MDSVLNLIGQAAQKTSTHGTPPSDLWLTPDEAVAALGLDGGPIPTGWDPLDRQLRKGGIPPGRIMVVGGPPFAGKTTVVAAIALAMAQHVPVFALFSDEGRSQAAVRIGVMLGLKLEDIDNDPVTAGTQMVDLLGERSIYMLKPDTDQSYADDVVKFAASRVDPGQPALIVLDSVQTILSTKPHDDQSPESPRLAAKRLVIDCRSWADSHKFIFLLTSQANRAFYRSKKDDENAVAIAAFSESGQIEYMADIAIVLSLPDENSEVVKVRFVKNRLKGSAKNFSVKYSPDTGRLVEVDQAEADVAAQEASRARLKPVEAAILHELRNADDGLSRANLSELTHKRKVDLLAGIESLVDSKKIFSTKSRRNILYFAVEGR